MKWKKCSRRLMLGATLVIFGVFPASAAKVRSFADMQGVIHITNEDEAPVNAAGPKDRVNTAHKLGPDDVSDISSESPGNFPDRVPRDKRYKLQALYHDQIVLPR
jgi:hypothetical protein